MKRIIITAAVASLITGNAFAHQTNPMPMKDVKTMDVTMMMPSANDTASTTGYKSAMMKMMQAVPKFSGDADVDFMKQMRVHHQAAIDMAKVVLANGKDAETKTLAQDIIAAQEKEIMSIDAWLKKKNV